LAGALRTGASKLFEEIFPVLVTNLGWAMLAGALVYVAGLVPLALLLLPLIEPLTTGLARIAALAARDRVVPLRAFVDGMTERFWVKLGLGAIQAAILLVALMNVVVAPSLGGLFGAISMVLSVYVAAATFAYGLVFWTLLSDPDRRGMAIRQIARLAMAVVLTRPLQVGFLLLLAGLSIGVMASLIVPLLFLPSFVLITIAAYVLPAADLVQSLAPRAP
jgi:hypothetical protein